MKGAIGSGRDTATPRSINRVVADAISLGLAVEPFTEMPYSAQMTELFPNNLPHTALSLCYQFAPVPAGSLVPLIEFLLMPKFDSLVPVLLYLAGTAAISIAAASFVTEARSKSLHDADAEAALRASSDAGRACNTTAWIRPQHL